MLRITLIGFGAIGKEVSSLLAADDTLLIDTVVVPAAALAASREAAGVALRRPPRFTTRLELGIERPDLIVECAGHSAIEQHIILALEAGIPCLIVSMGALSATGMLERLEQAAKKGKTQVQLLPGAIGAIDALAAARIGGLEKVLYVGRKPPLAWKDTAAEEAYALDTIRVPTRIFQGTAREASSRFPKNANVAATLALSGLGLDDTQVELYADPTLSENQHHLEASGAFGFFELTMRGRPLLANPKTSALTVYSVVRAITNRAHSLVI